jgi:hypothetical protein
MTDESSFDAPRVGYKRPPQHTRFAPGKSGNPRGRQKGNVNLATDVKRTLTTSVRLKDQGKVKHVSTQQAALMRLKEKALNGDARALDRLLALAQAFNNDVALGSSVVDGLADEDQAILDQYVAARTTPTSANPDSESTDGDGDHE